ncbi:MAG: recombinase RecT [Oscillospiraceae bacterium]|nr:recombinase RecT [Oscillospiraceae bacterium]
MANEGIIKTKTTSQGELAKKPQEKSLTGLIKSMEGEIKKALPSVITPERFTRMALTAIRTTPGLTSCEPMSFLAAMMSAAQLGLEPNTPLGQAYILPYKNTKKNITEVQFQIGYKGLIDLAYRSGEVEVVQAQCVYANDKFECEYGIEPKLKHVPADSNRGDLVKVYAMFRTKSGGYGFEVMSVEDIRAHAKKYSKAFSSQYSPWTTSFEEMAKKTVLKKALKYAPLKSDFVRAVSQDNAVKNEISDDMYEVSGDIIDITDTQVVDESTGEVIEITEQ